MKVKGSKLIVLGDIGKMFLCYNGKLWTRILIIEGMLDHYVGEFILTKKLGSTIHKIGKKKKKSHNKK